MIGRKRDRPLERRKDCPTCGGTGKYLDKVWSRDRTTNKKVSHTTRTRCPRCKGRGYI